MRCVEGIPLQIPPFKKRTFLENTRLPMPGSFVWDEVNDQTNQTSMAVSPAQERWEENVGGLPTIARKLELKIPARQAITINLNDDASGEITE
jgi:hypothetical protein